MGIVHGTDATGIDAWVTNCRQRPWIAAAAATQAGGPVRDSLAIEAASIGGFGSARVGSTCSVMKLLLGCVG